MLTRGVLISLLLGIVNNPQVAVAATEPATVRANIEKSLAALMQSGPTFVKRSGCVSCHHNTLPLMATSLARQHGLRFDEQSEAQQLKMIVGTTGGFREAMLETTDSVPDIQVNGPYVLLALAAQKYPADDLTAAVVHDIASKQIVDGSWPSYVNRAPIENGAIQATAMSVRAIQLYGVPGRKAEWDQRIAQAREWLLKATPKTTEDKVMLAAGLGWSAAKPDEVKSAVKALLAEQRPDGGWAQLPALESDAYATGKVLVALHETGYLPVSDPAYQRGAAYLIRTQLADGTWRVKTRAFPFQPLKESGFPHGRDQWISAAATSWAAMALTYTVEPNRPIGSGDAN